MEKLWFYAKFHKPGIHILKMISIWANGIFHAIVHYISLWAQTEKAMGQQTFPIKGQIEISRALWDIQGWLQLLNYIL